MRDFHELESWRRAHQLALDVYRAKESGPKNEIFGLTIEVRRTAVSIPTRIAEGCGRDGNAELSAYLQKARATASELGYLLLLCKDLGYLAEGVHDQLVNDVVEVRKTMSGLLKRL